MIASLCRTVPILCLVFVLIPQTVCGQVKPKATGKVTIRGQIVPHPEFQQAWTGERLAMAPAEMTARLREYVDLPLPPLPAGFETWPAARQQEWEAEFIASEAGQQHLNRNEALLAAALSLDIKFEEDGSFVIFDVPPGEYAIQGRKDKTIGEYTYAFEVFGQLTIQSDVELVKLAPMVIDVTPLLAPGQSAPPLEVEGITVQPDRPLLLNFWSRQGPLVLDQQRQIQETAAAFSKSGLTLVSINIDDDAASARKLVQEQQWKLGQQAYLGSLQHETLYHYGVRGVPSWWLIDGQGKIVLPPGQLVRGVQNGESLQSLVAAELVGDGRPTPAPSNRSEK